MHLLREHKNTLRVKSAGPKTLGRENKYLWGLVEIAMDNGNLCKLLGLHLCYLV